MVRAATTVSRVWIQPWCGSRTLIETATSVPTTPTPTTCFHTENPSRRAAVASAKGAENMRKKTKNGSGTPLMYPKRPLASWRPPAMPSPLTIPPKNSAESQQMGTQTRPTTHTRAVALSADPGAVARSRYSTKQAGTAMPPRRNCMITTEGRMLHHSLTR
jgi:hypothetical protein